MFQALSTQERGVSSGPDSTDQEHVGRRIMLPNRIEICLLIGLSANELNWAPKLRCLTPQTLNAWSHVALDM